MITSDDLRGELRDLHRKAEPEVLAPLVMQAKTGPDERALILSKAQRLLVDLRAGQSKGWVNQFLQEYRLGTEEGTALLSLAEAFLRVPDAYTSDRLISDKMGGADWGAHAGASANKMVNSATWGLVLGKAVVGASPEANVLRRLVARSGEPFVRRAVSQAMKLMGEVFVMGRNIEEAIGRMNKRENRGFVASFDMLGEAARTMDDAYRYFESYRHAADVAGAAGNGHSISVKLSALHPRYEPARAGICIPIISEMVLDLALRCRESGVALTVDAEESERLMISLDIIRDVARHPSLEGWDGFGMAIQAYSKRGLAVVKWADALGAETGSKINTRLVKGAYWDTEIKHTQEMGLSDFPLFTRKIATDVSYLACAREMIRSRHLVPAFATHNALTIATLLHWTSEAGLPKDGYEFQRLHGMGEGLYERMARDEGYRVRTYAPVGGHADLLAYLVRRLLENGANTSFVHQFTSSDVNEDELLADPVDKVEAVGGTRHPGIALPQDLFMPERKNSIGLDLEDRENLQGLAERLRKPVTVALRGEKDVDECIDTCHRAFRDWSMTSIDKRAACLEKFADLMEERREELMAVLVQEAKKNIPDALGDVREAVDFCRYYAAQAREKLKPIELPGPTGEQNILRMEGRGVWACIAPWNFPLAIFVGQVAAALVTGNTVVAKPAPQTPQIAALAVRLAREAGVPRGALQLAVGGAETGAALTYDRRIAGIAFTGSNATSKVIARSLVAEDDRPLIPLIAETGGINTMIVDSTALTEQVVRDVIISGFQSAGQRCSAMRLLLIQEEVYDRTIEMLKGAMDALVIGDPHEPDTDIGPVIDEPSYYKLNAYREAWHKNVIHSCEVPGKDKGLFVPPTLIHLDSMDDLDKEWFGPIIHVATWKGSELDRTVDRVNAKGYGLTMGIHSRILRAADQVEKRAEVGNLYINRSMIGAIVGSQPFGGEGLSGTGPKAGGPHYLYRFCAERTTSTDMTSAGGNATLLSMGDGI